LLYRNFATQEELDAQYDLENTVEDISLYTILTRGEREVRAELDHRLDVPFGPTLAEHLDLYPGAKGRRAPRPSSSTYTAAIGARGGARSWLRRPRSGFEGGSDRRGQLRPLS
jgi:hypothetical protein